MSTAFVPAVNQNPEMFMSASEIAKEWAKLGLAGVAGAGGAGIGVEIASMIDD